MNKEIVKALIESEMDSDQVVSSFEQGWYQALDWVCNLLDSLEESSSEEAKL